MQLLSLLSLALQAAVVLSAAASPSPPLKDSFYNVPANVGDYKDGSIIDSRPAPAPTTGFIFKLSLKNAWQLLVKSTDSHGNPTAIVTTVFEPLQGDASKVLSYQTWEDSANIDCLPSYGFLKGSSLATMETKLELHWINAALEKGYYVVSPDYEGPKSAFTAGLQAGHAVLDSIRATLNSQNVTGILPDAQVVMWGYSGGSLATGWAASLAPKYAPDLQKLLIGASVGGFVTNVTSVALTVDGGTFSALAGSGIAGLSSEYPELQKAIYAEITPDRVAHFNRSFQHCLMAGFLYLPFTHYLTGLDPLISSGLLFLDEPVVKKVLDENILGVDPTLLPEIPIFLYHGVKDDVVPFEENAQRIFDLWAQRGIKSLEFSADLSAIHLVEFFAGAPAALKWIANRFEGRAPVEGAVKTTLESNLLYNGIEDKTRDYFKSGVLALAETDEAPELKAFMASWGGGLIEEMKW